jgi:asparagine synthase (glutamine-hydrolysing)
MCSGLEARVPFADTRIMQFMYNVPWKMKSENGVEKSLLRNAMKGLLPDEVLFGKKSPYPKTYDPHYEKLLAGNLIEVIEDTSSPVNRLVDKNKVYAFINEKKDYGKPWYGQLMAGPQMLAYLLQINYWLRKFNL